MIIKKRSESKITPRLRADEADGMVEPEKLIELKLSFSLWRLRPTRRNSVFDGFNDKRLRVNQEWT